VAEDARIAALKRRCETDLEFLCTKVLGMSVWQKGLHDEIAQFLDAPGNKKLLLVPRGHFKSTLASVAWPIQLLLRDPNTRILIANAVWDKSREFLGQISDYLTWASPLPELYGKFDGPGSRFTVDHLTIAQKKDASKRGVSVATAGVESALTGGHPDVIILDDLVGATNVGTKEQLMKPLTFYRQALDLLAPGGKLVVIGTRWAVGDAYGHMIETEMDTLNGLKVSTEDRGKWREKLKASIVARR
jgi:hypothetical protein